MAELNTGDGKHKSEAVENRNNTKSEYDALPADARKECDSRSLSVLIKLASIDTHVIESRTDLNLHADQCAIGSSALITHDFD